MYILFLYRPPDFHTAETRPVFANGILATIYGVQKMLNKKRGLDKRDSIKDKQLQR